MKRVHYLLIVALVLPGQLEAGPWPRAAGKGLVQIGFSTIGYNKVYDDRSQKRSIPFDVRDNVVQMFAEYGFPADLTVSAALPLKFISATSSLPGGTRFSASGIGDIDITVKRTFYNEAGVVLSGELLFGIPSGSRADVNGLFLGDGEFNFSPRILFGKSFHPLPLYLSAGLGFDVRSNNFSHNVTYDTEIGYGMYDGMLYAILQISGRESLSNKPTLPVGATTREQAAALFGLHGNNLEFLAIVPKLYFKASEHIGISVSYATAGHGRNVAGGAVIAGGVLYEF